MSERNLFITTGLYNHDAQDELHDILDSWAGPPIEKRCHGLYGMIKTGSPGRMLDEEFEKLGQLLVERKFPAPFRLMVAGDNTEDCCVYHWDGKSLWLHRPASPSRQWPFDPRNDDPVAEDDKRLCPEG